MNHLEYKTLPNFLNFTETPNYMKNQAFSLKKESKSTDNSNTMGESIL